MVPYYYSLPSHPVHLRFVGAWLMAVGNGHGGNVHVWWHRRVVATPRKIWYHGIHIYIYNTMIYHIFCILFIIFHYDSLWAYFPWNSCFDGRSDPSTCPQPCRFTRTLPPWLEKDDLRWLVGGWPTPLKNMSSSICQLEIFHILCELFVNWDDDMPFPINMEK